MAVVRQARSSPFFDPSLTGLLLLTLLLNMSLRSIVLLLELLFEVVAMCTGPSEWRKVGLVRLVERSREGRMGGRGIDLSYGHRHFDALFRFTAKDSAIRRHVCVAPANGDRNVAWPDELAVGGIEADPARGWQKCLTPGVGFDFGHVRTIEVAGNVTTRNSDQAEQRNADVRKILADARALFERFDGRGQAVGYAPLIREDLSHSFCYEEQSIDATTAAGDADPFAELENARVARDGALKCQEIEQPRALELALDGVIDAREVDRLSIDFDGGVRDDDDSIMKWNDREVMNFVALPIDVHCRTRVRSDGQMKVAKRLL